MAWSDRNSQEQLKEKSIAGNIPGGLFDKDWVVYAKEPFGGPDQILRYLSRYTHRTAISNERILNVDNQRVTFSWKDYKHNYQQQTTTINGAEFLRLFCLHILPPGFTRIRHYGFLSSAAKGKALHRIRKDLKATAPVRKKDKTSQQLAFERMGITPGICKCCGSRMVIIEFIPNQYREKQRAPPTPKLQPNKKFSA
ncbi:MAG TPA: transposase [Bacteroidales bacterium]|nr:transposase [Bacteroidales bacterium]